MPMKTLRLAVDAADLNSDSSKASIAAAAEILQNGGTVAFPTETVYGLGANALDPGAVAKIFAAKQRPAWDPLIVHVADRGMLDRVAVRVPPSAERLIDAFWPGPLTLLLPRHPDIPAAVTAGRPLVGVRMPQHPVAHALIHAANLPLAAPSANTFGLESTVVDPNENPCIVYRPGVITLEQIRAIGIDAIAYRETGAASDAEPESLPSPGIAMRHYAPRARLILVDGEGEEQRRAFEQAVLAAESADERLGLMLPSGFESAAIGKQELVYHWGAWNDKEELAQRLFAGLRWLDSAGATVIVCPLPPARGIGVAV